MSMLKSKTLCTPVAEKPASLPATKPEPTEAEQAEIRALAKRKKARRRAPRFTVHQQDGSKLQVMPAGVHADAAAARLMNALGTTDLDLAECLASQIVNATQSAGVERAGLRREPECRPGCGDGHRAPGTKPKRCWPPRWSGCTGLRWIC